MLHSMLNIDWNDEKQEIFNEKKKIRRNLLIFHVTTKTSNTYNTILFRKILCMAINDDIIK